MTLLVMVKKKRGGGRKGVGGGEGRWVCAGAEGQHSGFSYFLCFGGVLRFVESMWCFMDPFEGVLGWV